MKIKKAYLAVNFDGNTVICGSKPVRVNGRWVIDTRSRWTTDSSTWLFRKEFPRGYMNMNRTWADEPVCIGDVII